MKIVESVTIGVIAVGIFALFWLNIFFPESIIVLILNDIAILFGCLLAITAMLKKSEEEKGDEKNGTDK